MSRRRGRRIRFIRGRGRASVSMSHLELRRLQRIVNVSDETVMLKMGKNEALILFELLADFHSQPELRIADNADRLALIRIQGALEKTLIEPFSKEYKQLIERARASLEREWAETD